MVGNDTWFGTAISQLWRTGSASAHGYHWTEVFLGSPGEFDEVSFNMALYGAMLMLNEAIILYTNRATNHV